MLRKRTISWMASLCFILLAVTGHAQQSFIQQKNFPLLSAIQKNDGIKELIAENELLDGLKQQKMALLKNRLNIDSLANYIAIDSIALDFSFSEPEMNQVIAQFQELAEHPLMKPFIQHLKESHLFYLDESKADTTFLRLAFMREMMGINQMIAVYAQGNEPRYPKIDSVSYPVQSEYYQKVITITALNISDDLEKMSLFFEPSLSFALWLLEINNRDEAARFEPMELGENAEAVALVSKTDWRKYPYSALLIPGHGPEEAGVALSPLGRMRCKLAADRFRKGLAPFIILSGGYVHPFQTPFCEAMQMKKELMSRYGIPESALIIEPHARHTTTNFRNAARLMFKYRFPVDRKALCTTTVDQSFYITNSIFDQRCLQELGYLPYQLGQRLNRNDVEFIPQVAALSCDSHDPLDP